MSADNARRLTICNVRGLHARASSKFAALAEKFEAEVIVSKDMTEVTGTSIMGLMMLAASRGEEITLSGSGVEIVAALDALEELIENKFGED